MTRSKFDKRLGNILSRRNMVSEDELARHMETAESESRSLTQILLEGDHLGEADLLEVLSEETRFPAVDVFKVRPEKSVVDLLPENLASYYGVVPVSRVANVLTLAVSNPFDILQLDDIGVHAPDVGPDGFQFPKLIANEALARQEIHGRVAGKAHLGKNH